MGEHTVGNQVKVLYIAGYGRSGSTILGNILGQVKGFAHVGELSELWGALGAKQVGCGCGVPVAACDMWAGVLKEAYGVMYKPPAAQMLDFHRRNVHTYNFVHCTTSERSQALQRRLAEPLAALEKLYRAIQEVFKCDVIVDSSKYPFYGYVLHLMQAIDPYVLHLIRDSRAGAYSLARKNPPCEGLLYHGPVNLLTSSLMWNYRNSALDVASRRFRHPLLRLRYEDFVANPQGSLGRILELVGKTSSSLPLEDHKLNVNIQHTVHGNPSRFTTGRIEIRDNHEWAKQMKRHHKILVTALTWPLLIKYRYPIWSPILSQPDKNAALSETGIV